MDFSGRLVLCHGMRLARHTMEVMEHIMRRLHEVGSDRPQGQLQIMRDDLKRMIAVTGRISGRDLGSVIRDVKSVLKNPALMPTNIYYSLGGLYEQQQTAFYGLIAVFFAAVLLFLPCSYFSMRVFA
jgi:Cu/Ag efflux pump CusA